MEGSPERPVHDVLADHRDAWMALSDVTGAGIGRCGDRSCIVLYLLRDSREVREAIPDTVEGHPIRLQVTGRVEPRDPGGRGDGDPGGGA